MINKLSKQIYKNNQKKGFYESPKNIGEMLALIHSEVSEALEADRKDKHAVKNSNLENGSALLGNDTAYFRQEFEVAIKDTFEDELADVMIRVMDLAGYKGIDLEYHIKMKMAYNATREYKHGKKY